MHHLLNHLFSSQYYTFNRCYNIWAICAVLQLASITKSVLADKDELSQSDVTAMAASNFFVARMVGSGSLQDTVLAALVTGYSVRDGASSLHTELASAFLTTSATLGVVAYLAGLIPSIPVVGDLLAVVATGKLLAVVAMHGITNRADNGTVKEIVNGAILAGMAFDAISGGISFALDLDSILANVTLALFLYVSFQAMDNARQAVLDL